MNLDALEEFTERILHDESGPSSQESLYFAPLQSRQKHRNTHHSPDPIPRHRNHVERPQEVPILPTETAPRLRPNTVLSKDGRQRHRQPSSQRREYNAASENTKTQRQDTESRRTRQNSPGESSRNEDGLPRLPIQHPVENPRPSSLWQRQESDLILERTASEREEPKVMRRSRRPPNHETENRQAEEQAQPQRRPILDSNREYVVERPRHRIPEKTINDHSLLSDVYSESRRQNPQSRSRSKAPSLSGVYSGTDVTTNTHCNTRISVHERPISRRANTSNECRPAPSLYYDQHPAERSQTPPRSRRPSFSQNSDVQTTTDTRRYTSTRTAAVNKPSPPRGLSGIPQSRTINTRTATVDRSSTPRGRNRTPQSRAPKPADRDTELAQGAQQTSTRSSVCSDDSGVGMSTRWSRSADPVPASPTSRPSQREEELTGRHAQPSMSRASSRCETWSTGGDSGVFMSGSEDSARESSAPYRRPDRVKDRYYPPASNKDVEKRQRRRTRTSRSRSSSRNYDSSARVSRD